MTSFSLRTGYVNRIGAGGKTFFSLNLDFHLISIECIPLTPNYPNRVAKLFKPLRPIAVG